MTEQSYKLVVLIVCYRSADLTIDALHSLAPEVETVPNSHVVVCENGTGPESVEAIQGAIAANGWQDWVSLKVIHPNRGFAGGNNAVLRELLTWGTPPEFIMLLNSDTVVRPGALARMMREVEGHPEVGVIGPRLEWPDAEPQISAFRFQNPLSALDAGACTSVVSKLLAKWLVPIPVSDNAFEPRWVSFACALIRLETLQQVGVLDDGYYLYFDDVDYCRRAWKAGWRVRYCPEAHVVHLRGKSNPVKELSAKRMRRPAYFYFSRSRYYAKFYGRSGLWLTNFLWCVGRSISLFREVFGHKKRHTCEHEARDIWINAWTPLRYDHVPKQSDETESPSNADPSKEAGQHAAA